MNELGVKTHQLNFRNGDFLIIESEDGEWIYKIRTGPIGRIGSCLKAISYVIRAYLKNYWNGKIILTDIWTIDRQQ